MANQGYWILLPGAAAVALLALLSGFFSGLAVAKDASTIKVNPGKRTLILWTSPRCISTAFERAIMNLQGIKVLHEPFGGPHYFGPERMSERYAADTPDPKETFEAVKQRVLGEYEGKAVVFSKDMAYYLRGRDDIVEALLQDPSVTHTFLIRHPAKVVPSLYIKSHGGSKGIAHSKTGWDHFDAREVGMLDLHALFRKAQTASGVTPTVVDADLMLTDPESILKKYCMETGLNYVEGMTQWSPGAVAEWDTWPGWHDDALESSGLVKKESKRPPSMKDLEQYPQEVRDSVTMSIDAYDEMLKHALI